MPSTRIGIVCENDPFEFERNHSVKRVIGYKEAASCIVQKIGVVCSVLRNGRFDSSILGG